MQLPFTACMPAQHGTGTTPYALTLLPLSTQAGRVPSHLHVASGQLEGLALQFLSHHAWSTVSLRLEHALSVSAGPSSRWSAVRCEDAWAAWSARGVWDVTRSRPRVYRVLSTC
mgnify:CR=1 FL=1